MANETVELIGKAFGAYVKESGSRQVIVGGTTGLSSDRLRDAITRGLLDAGCDVADIGLVVTPVLYYCRVHFGVDGGVMITGSHNPPDENGLKLALGTGTIYGDEIQKLKDIAVTGSFTSGTDRLEKLDAVSPYLTMLKEKIRLGPRKLKVAVDCGNGTGSLFALPILEACGCEVIPLYCESDGSSPTTSRTRSKQQTWRSCERPSRKRTPTSASPLTVTLTGSAWLMRRAASFGEIC